MGVPPSGPGHSAEPEPISVVSAETASVPNADDCENDLQRGYAAWERGEPFDEFQSAEWADGWKTADDFAWWQRLATALGGSVHGFSHRYAGSFNIKGQIHSLDGTLLDAVVAIITLASAGEAGTATTVQQGVVHEHAVGDSRDAQGDAP